MTHVSVLLVRLDARGRFAQIRAVQTHSPWITRELGSFAAFQPLLSGEAGTAQTLRVARQLVDAGVKDPRVNRTAIEIVRGTPQYDDLAKIEAIYNWVTANFTYIQDPVGPNGAKETLRPVVDLLQLRAGDCDDINAVLFPALFGTLGYRTRIVTIAGDPQSPREFSHVYCEVEFEGEWIPIDAARPGARFGEEPPYYFRKKTWPMTDANSFSLMGERTLNGYVGAVGDVHRAMGDSLRRAGMGDMGDAAQDIAAAGTAAAQVISAANQNPYSSSFYTNNPYGLATAAAPGLVAPGLGYPTVSLTSNSIVPWLIGAALVALILVERK